MYAVEMQDLTKQYGSKTVVDGLNLKIEEGEFFAMLGSNGAGKTTTIKMLSCLVEPTAGDALMLGYSIRKEENAVKEMINVSPQETAVAPKLTVRENLEMIARLYGFSMEEAVQKTEHLMETFGQVPVRWLAAQAQYCNGSNQSAQDSVSGRTDLGAGCTG